MKLLFDQGDALKDLGDALMGLKASASAPPSQNSRWWLIGVSAQRGVRLTDRGYKAQKKSFWIELELQSPF